MNRGTFGTRWGRGAILALVLGTVCVAGCSQGALYHMFKGDEKLKAEHPLTPKGNKRDVTVAVSVTTQPGVAPGVDLDLADKIGSQLKVISDANKSAKINIVDQVKVNNFKTSDPNRWSLGNPGEFAAQVGADYWIDVQILDFSLVDKEFAGEICRGRATLDVSVFEAGMKTRKYGYSLVSQAPQRTNDMAQKSVYRNKYIGELATELAFKHISYNKEQERALFGK